MTPLTLRPQSQLPDEFPNLVAGAYGLRAIRRSDAEDWHRILSDARVNEFTSSAEMSVEEVSALIDGFEEGFSRQVGDPLGAV